MALGIIVKNAVKAGPEEVAASLVDLTRNLPPEEADPLLSASARNIATVLARNDPSAAAEWVMGLPAFKNRSGVLSGVANEWARHDVEAVSDWLGELDRGADRDGGISGLVAQIASKNPAGASSGQMRSMTTTSARSS